MRTNDVRFFFWPRGIADKIESKHQVTQDEVENAFYVRAARIRKRTRKRHYLLSRTDSGRYLIVWFDWKPPDTAIIVSARDMTTAERRLFNRK